MESPNHICVSKESYVGCRIKNGLEGGGARQERTQRDCQQAVVTVVQERDDSGSCDLSGGSGWREKVSHLNYLESRIDKSQ